ncbi:DUF1700 domain-containing protein [Aquibacillus halophilus]|uniref:DUF1700 domain-containing protein n=1 Tax=Aquibacillus halophilus TaxID=930132 RepID=A0A6A8DEP2_9BACI|nr:DUF1700 domain-containing protein [Aquibacillus halophilus]
MNKKYFINELNYHLRKIPHLDRKSIIQDFNERFDVGLIDFKTEEEIAAELGAPKFIASEILEGYQNTSEGNRPDDNNRNNQKEKDQPINVSRAIIATIGLVLFNLIFLLGPVVAIFAVYLSLSAVGIAFTITPIAWIVSIIIGQASDLLGEFFIVLTLCSLGILLSVGMIQIGKILYRLTAKYLKVNIRIIKG